MGGLIHQESLGARQSKAPGHAHRRRDGGEEKPRLKLTEHIAVDPPFARAHEVPTI